MGYAVRTEADGSRTEWDTKLCGHCQRLIMYASRAKPDEDYGGFCLRCGKVICRECTNARKCVPFERRLEEMESRGRMLRSMGL